MNRVHDAGGSMQGMTVVLVGRWWAGAGGASPPPPAGGSSHQVQCSTLSEVSPSRSTPLRLSSTPHKPSSVQLPTSSKYSINSSKVLAIPGFVISHDFPLTDQPPMEITFNVLKPKEEFIKKTQHTPSISSSTTSKAQCQHKNHQQLTRPYQES